jgi:hypothetical protein
MTSNFWNFFDSVVCIHTQASPERKPKFSAMSSRFGMTSVEYFGISKHPAGPIVGSFEAHQAVWRKAYESNHKNVLVFEDEATILNLPSEQAMHEITSFLKFDQNWELFFLGTNPRVFSERTKRVANYSVIRSVHSDSAYAYVASRKFMAKMIRLDYTMLEFPIEYVHGLNRHAFAVFPTWFHKENDWMHLTMLQGKNHYAYYVNMPLTSVLWIAFALVVILFLLVIFTRKK